MRFLDLLRSTSNKPEPASSIEAALADARAAQDAAEQAIRDLSERRAAALLSGSDDELDAIDAATTRAYRDADRAALGIGELEKRLTAAREREHTGRLDALYREGLEHQQAAADALRKFGALAADGARLLSEIEVRKERIGGILAELRANGDQRELHSPESLVSTAPGLHPPFAQQAKLPDPTRPGYWYWPLNVHADPDRAAELAFALKPEGAK